MRASTLHAQPSAIVAGASTAQTESLTRHLRRQSLLSLRLKEHATRIAWQLAVVRHDSASASVFDAEHGAIMSELRARRVL